MVSVTETFIGAESFQPTTTTFRSPALWGAVKGTGTEVEKSGGIAAFTWANGVNASTVQVKPWLEVSVPSVAVTVTLNVPTLAPVSAPAINPVFALIVTP